MMVGSVKCNREQLYATKVWACIVKFIWTGKSMFVTMAVRESDLHTNFENIPTKS